MPVLYFHPWEFDEEMMHLPLRALSRFRTYVGINHSRGRLEQILSKYHFSRACDVAGELPLDDLPSYRVSPMPAAMAVTS